MTIQTGDRDPAAPNAQQRQDTVAYMKVVVDMCAQPGGEIVTVVPGRVGKTVAEATPQEEWTWVVAELREVAGFAQQKSVKIALEPLNRLELMDPAYSTCTLETTTVSRLVMARSTGRESYQVCVRWDIMAIWLSNLSCPWTEVHWALWCLRNRDRIYACLCGADAVHHRSLLWCAVEPALSGLLERNAATLRLLLE